MLYVQGGSRTVDGMERACRMLWELPILPNNAINPGLAATIASSPQLLPALQVQFIACECNTLPDSVMANNLIVFAAVLVNQDMKAAIGLTAKLLYPVQPLALSAKP